MQEKPHLEASGAVDGAGVHEYSARHKLHGAILWDTPDLAGAAGPADCVEEQLARRNVLLVKDAPVRQHSNWFHACMRYAWQCMSGACGHGRACMHKGLTFRRSKGQSPTTGCTCPWAALPGQADNRPQ